MVTPRTVVSQPPTVDLLGPHLQSTPGRAGYYAGSGCLWLDMFYVTALHALTAPSCKFTLWIG